MFRFVVKKFMMLPNTSEFANPESPFTKYAASTAKNIIGCMRNPLSLPFRVIIMRMFFRVNAFRGS